MKRIDKGLLLAFLLLAAGVISVFFPFNTLNGWRFLGFYLETNKYNELGDFIGGITTPFLSVSAFILLYLTYNSQKLELKLNRELMEKQGDSLAIQQFESTFFNLLNLYNEIVNNIDVTKITISRVVGAPNNKSEKRIDFKGRDCLKYFYNNFYNDCSDRLKKESTNHFVELEIIKEVYAKYYKLYQSDLAHYFTNLYHIIKFVKNSNVKDKQMYTNIVRAQLSAFELALLFYNCLGENGEKFKPLIEEFQLLKILDTDVLVSAEHVQYYNSSAFYKLHKAS